MAVPFPHVYGHTTAVQVHRRQLQSKDRSGQYGFISCFFGMTDGQIYRSILAFDKEKLEMGNAALQTIVEGSLYDMH